jgi:hypothetical protein
VEGGGARPREDRTGVLVTIVFRVAVETTEPGEGRVGRETVRR